MAAPDVVLTVLLTGNPDPQRPGSPMRPDPDMLALWAQSTAVAFDPIVFADELTEPPPFATLVKVGPGMPNPYLQRWVIFHSWLQDNDARWVCITDGTDVEMLNDPRPHMEPGVLYVGHERGRVGSRWMTSRHRPYVRWLRHNARLRTLNPGVVGGDHATVLEFTAAMVAEFERIDVNGLNGDMASFNYVTRLPQWRDRVQWGEQWVTPFKKFQRNGYSSFRHK